MQLELNIYRKWETPLSVCGELLVNTVLVMYTLEPARANPVHPGHPCIPAGRYRARLTMSPHLGYVCPELLDVPGRTAIRIHVGNFPRDVEGCTAVGVRHQPDELFASESAFEQLMRMLASYEDIFVTYHDGPPFQEEENDGEQRTAGASGEAAPSGTTVTGVRSGNASAGDFRLST